MGYTLLNTLSKLWFTQFCNSVLLCTCLLMSRVFFLFNCFCLGEKAEWFFCLFFCFCWEKAEVFFQYFYTKSFLCHEHCRFCAMSS